MKLNVQHIISIKGISNLILLLIFAISCQLVQGEPTVTATLNQDTVVMGDQMILHVVTISHKKEKIRWPLIAGKLQDVDVIGNSKLDTTVFGDSLRIEADIYLSVYQPGVVAIPGIEFKYKRNQINRAIRTKPIMVNVAGIEIDTTRGLMPIKPHMSVPLTWKEWLPMLIAIAIALLLIMALLFWLSKRKKKEEDAYRLKTEIIRPSHEVAMENLQSLKLKKLAEAGQHKEYYVQLTDIIRTYVEQRFAVPAMESTTDEIIDGLQATDANPKLIEKLENIFNEADLAKFAKAKPDETLCKKGMKDSMDFVQHTKDKTEEEQVLETRELISEEGENEEPKKEEA